MIGGPGMKCPRCQQDNPTHARFCLRCETRLTLACGSCGAEVPGGARFCLQCGQAVAAGTAARVGSPAPETYPPRHLAEKILMFKAALEGGRKLATVLCRSAERGCRCPVKMSSPRGYRAEPSWAGDRGALMITGRPRGRPRPA